MPAYSGGNRWVGVLALGPVPVPPALHQIAKRRAADLAVKRTSIWLEGQTIPVETVHKALAELSTVLGAHGDAARVAESLALARFVQQGKSEAGSWPKWARNAVLRYSANRRAFDGPEKYDLRRWGLGARADAPGPVRATRKNRDLTAERAIATSVKDVQRIFDIIDTARPALLDPSQAFDVDELPVPQHLAHALTDAGWEPEGLLRQRWLRLALTHVSFRHEQWSIPRTLLPEMLNGLGSRWCQLFVLDEFLADNPLASSHEQSQALNSLMPALAEQLAVRLHIADAMLLSRGEALAASEPNKRSRVVASVTWQVIGVMCLLGGMTAAAGLISRSYRSSVETIANDTSSVDWVTILNQQIDLAVTWAYDTSEPDHQLIHRAVVTDRRRRSVSGSGGSKKIARHAAAESFIRRYLPELARAQMRSRAPGRRSASPVKAARYPGTGVAHQNTVRDLQRVFELPPASAPLLDQALTHSSWAYEHSALVASVGQRDYAALSRLGAVVGDALAAHDQTVRVAGRILEPTEDEARVMTLEDGRLWDLFREFRLEPGLLVGAGITDLQLPSIGAGAMQAVLAVAWKYRREGLLTRRPSPLDEWLRIPNGLLDEITALQNMCAEFQINYEFDVRQRGLDHEKQFTCRLRFEDSAGDFVVSGPAGTSKAAAKRRASAIALAAVEGISGALVPDDAALTRFLLLKQIAGADAVDPRRALLRGWLGVSLIASGDVPAFERWAARAEGITGPLSEGDLAKLRTYYERSLLVSRQGNLPFLRSRFSATTDWLKPVTAVEMKKDPMWSSLRAVAATLSAITATSDSSLREVLSRWYESAIGCMNVDLSSENLEGERDDLTATQATALRVMLDAASATITESAPQDRLQVAVYRREGSAYVTLAAQAADLQASLAELARLLNESVSYMECVEIEHGWLLEARYVEHGNPRHWPDLGRVLEATADQRPDLASVARRCDELVCLIQGGVVPESADSSPQALAAGLHQRRNLI